MEGPRVSIKRRYSRKQQETLLEISVLTSLIALGVIIVLIISHVYVNYSIYKNERDMEIISANLAEMQKQIDSTKEQEKEYKSQLDELQAQLAKYQAIVIPDSMKSE